MLTRLSYTIQFTVVTRTRTFSVTPSKVNVYNVEDAIASARQTAGNLAHHFQEPVRWMIPALDARGTFRPCQQA